MMGLAERFPVRRFHTRSPRGARQRRKTAGLRRRFRMPVDFRPPERASAGEDAVAGAVRNSS